MVSARPTWTTTDINCFPEEALLRWGHSTVASESSLFILDSARGRGKSSHTGWKKRERSSQRIPKTTGRESLEDPGYNCPIFPPLNPTALLLIHQARALNLNCKSQPHTSELGIYHALSSDKLNKSPLRAEDSSPAGGPLWGGSPPGKFMRPDLSSPPQHVNFVLVVPATEYRARMTYVGTASST